MRCSKTIRVSKGSSRYPRYSLLRPASPMLRRKTSLAPRPRRSPLVWSCRLALFTPTLLSLARLAYVLPKSASSTAHGPAKTEDWGAIRRSFTFDRLLSDEESKSSRCRPGPPPVSHQSRLQINTGGCARLGGTGIGHESRSLPPDWFSNAW